MTRLQIKLPVSCLWGRGVLRDMSFFVQATGVLSGTLVTPTPLAPPVFPTLSCKVGREEPRVGLTEPKSAICLS